MELRNEEMNTNKIIPVKDASVAIVQRKPEKLNPGLCDTYAAL